MKYHDEVDEFDHAPILTSVSRRTFLGGIGGIAVAFVGMAGASVDAPEAMAAPAPRRPNLISNPSFELSPTGASPTGWQISFSG